MMKLNRTLVFFLSVILFLNSCEKEKEKEIEQPKEFMRLAQTQPELYDDLPLTDLEYGISQAIEMLDKSQKNELIFGSRKVDKNDYILSLKLLELKISSGITKDDFNSLVKNNFDFYEVYGEGKWGEVLITSYYEPVLDGALVKSGQFTQPLYAVPDDLVTIHLDKFVETFNGLSPIKEQVLDGHNKIKILRGRMAPPYNKGGSANIVPYYTREEIDSDLKLQGRAKELAWVDPIDAFFLQVQGSGSVVFEDGTKIRLGYASQNGYPFYAIGKHLLDTIPKEKMSKQSIEDYLRSLPVEEMREILNLNTSYVFFRKLDTKPITTFGTEVVDGRTIATDKRYFPTGTLAFIQFKKPVFESPQSRHPSEWVDTSRYVLDHDTGGAITGTDRVDLFWGSGDSAGQSAGVMKQQGKLYYLVPMESLLEKFKQAQN